MALSLSQTAALKHVLKPGMRVASFGYPDIIAPAKVWCSLFPERSTIVGWDQFIYHKDSEAICMRHGIEPRGIPEAVFFFKQLGCTLDVYDIVRERGCETYCDLNVPMETASFYDVVLDVGTAEHCFNIAQAIMNMANQVKVGGVIIHENPANWGNHGFYNLNPTLFADFYAANGFELLECKLVTRDGRSAKVPLTRRFHFSDEEVNVFAMAKRVTFQGLVYPVQGKYAHLIPAAGVDRTKDGTNG